MPAIHLPIRQLVEFLLRTGSIDSRFAGFDRALEGARIHRRLQKAAGEGYEAEVFLTAEREADGISFTLEGRADGIFTDEGGPVTIDEIKTTAVPFEEITEEMNPCHWAQGMVYAAIYSDQQSLSKINVRLTYYQLDTDQIIRFVRHFSREELDAFLRGLLQQYAPWAQRQLDWSVRRAESLSALRFPFAEYRPGQRALAGRACRAGKDADHKGGTRLFCQAPTGIGKTMSAIFPALRSMGEGSGEKLFYLTARNTTQAAAEDAIARLRAADPGLALRSVTLTAKEKVCLHPDAEGRPACLPELCPFANGYYSRVKDVLAALLDGPGSFDRAALADTARQFSVCPFELGLDLSEWCDVVIGDYNYLFDPVVHLKRFFDASGDWLFLIDEAHNLPDRARAMYSASFSKSSLTDAKRALGKGKSALKTALSKADKAFLEARKLCGKLAPRRAALETAPEEAAQTSLLPGPADAPALELPEPIFAREGTVFLRELPAALLTPLRAVQAPLQDWLEANPDADAHAQLLDLYFAVQDITRAAERYDSHFLTQLSAYGSELALHLLCLDPAPFVDASLAAGRSAALFSATLAPPGRAGLPGRPGRGAGKPISGRKSRAVLPAEYLHPLPRPGRQRAGGFGRSGPAGAEQNRQLSGLFPQLCLPAAGARGLCGTVSRHPHPCAGEQSRRCRTGRVSRRICAGPQRNSAGVRGTGRRVRRGRGPGRGPAHRLRHRGRGPAPGEPPAGNAAPLL